MRNVEDHRMSGAGVPSDEEGRMSGAGVPSYVARSSIVDREKNTREENVRAITRAKFNCRKIKKECGRYKILFYSTSPSVSGKIGLNTASLSTAEQFKVGYDYFVDFTEVEKAK